MSNEHLKTPKVQATMERVGAIMADRITPLFKPGALVTVIVRFPDNDEADFFMSDRSETLSDLRRFLARCESRDGIEHETRADAGSDERPDSCVWKQRGMDCGDNTAAWCGRCPQGSQEEVER